VGGRRFERERRVGPADAGPGGDMHLDAIAHFLQDVAYADLVDADPEYETAWIVRRTRVEVEIPPRFAELLALTTWCSGTAAAAVTRRTSARGEHGGRFEAESVWVQVDPESRRPVRLTDRFHEIYGESAAGARARTKLSHPAAAPSGATPTEWSFSAADVDVAAHVNNAAYLRIAEALIAPAPGAAYELEAEYRTGIGPGLALVLREGPTAWVLPDAEAEAAATLRCQSG
jgi:acyl-ACP thioesterase